MSLHEPDPLLIQKILVPQRPDRAQIDHAAGKFVRQRIAGEHVDFLMVAAIDDHQLAGAGDLTGEPHAAAAHHTAIDKQRDRIAHVALTAREWPDISPPLSLSVLEVIILQMALARFIANRAIDRMIDQQVLFHLSPATFYSLAVGDEHRAVGRRRLAGRD